MLILLSHRQARTALVAICVLCTLTMGCRRHPTADQKVAVAKTRQSLLRAADSKQVSHARFLPKQKATSATLFEALNAKSRGMDFLSEWKPRNQAETLLLKTGFTGGGVALGDFDGDGLTDMFLTRPHGGGKLFRNRGDFQFEDVTVAANVSFPDDWHTGAVFCDVNNDGHLDLAVGCYNSPNRLLLNSGEGSFRDVSASSGFDFAGATVKPLFADYDGDGDLDVYIVTNRLEPQQPTKIRYTGKAGAYDVAPEHQELAMVINLPSGEQKFAKAGQFDRLYRNDLKDGQIRFTDVSRQAGIQGNFHGLDACWWDADRDGDPDLYVTNDFTDPDQFFRNNGDGTFTDVTQASMPCTPWFAMGCDVGDLNNDGLLDLLAADMAGTTHYREKMAMGSMDAVSWFLETAEPRQFMRNTLFINTGTSRFVEAAHLAGLAKSDWTWSVKIADFDNDGLEDVFFTNGFTRDYLNSDFNNQLKARGNGAQSLAWYDAPRLDEQNLVFQNQGDLHFRDVSRAWGLDHVGISFGAAVGDLDNDGDLDIVVNNFEAQPSLYRNTSGANNSCTVQLVGQRCNRQAIGAMLEFTTSTGKQLRYHQTGSGFLSSDDIKIHVGLGKAEVIESIAVHWPSGYTQEVRAVAANQLLTIHEDTTIEASSLAIPSTRPLFRETDWLGGIRHRETPYDDFAEQPLLPNKLSQLGPGMTVGDVNGDGLLDLYLGGATGDTGKLVVQISTGNFQLAPLECFELHRASEDMGCLFFDADGDQDLDLYVVSGGVEHPVDSADYEDRLYINESTPRNVRFRHDVDMLPATRASGGPVSAADFDRDGDLDLFVGSRVVPGQYPLTPMSQLLRNDHGRFSRVEDEPVVDVGMVTGALWSDYDDDGWVDLIVACDYGPIQVFRNQDGSFTNVSSELGTSELLGWWNSITGADVDLDGDTDYLVGNLGRNTKYHPTEKMPQYLFYGNFQGGEQYHIVEAKSAEAGLLPTRGRSCSSNAMPFIASKFETYHGFASASLSDIYGDDRLAQAHRVAVTQVQSGVLLNRASADGQRIFTFRPFPVAAQLAPVFGVEVMNANDDTIPDVFLAQNFYTPQRETGRMSGGISCMLLGNGDGTYLAMPATQTGLVIPEDAKSTVVCDLNHDGKLDLLVGINDGQPRTFTLDQSRSMQVSEKAKTERYRGAGYLSGGWSGD